SRSDDCSWVSFAIVAGREGEGDSRVEGRRRTLDEALEVAHQEMANDEKLGYRDARLVWRNGHLVAVVRPTAVPGGTPFIMCFDPAEEAANFPAIDAACAAYFSAREAMSKATRDVTAYRETIPNEPTVAQRAELSRLSKVSLDRHRTMNQHRAEVT